MVFFVEGFLALAVENCFLRFNFAVFCRTVFIYGVTLSLKNNTIVQVTTESLYVL